jgi:hypothetical protein
MKLNQTVGVVVAQNHTMRDQNKNDSRNNRREALNLETHETETHNE